MGFEVVRKRGGAKRGEGAGKEGSKSGKSSSGGSEVLSRERGSSKRRGERPIKLRMGVRQSLERKLKGKKAPAKTLDSSLSSVSLPSSSRTR